MKEKALSQPSQKFIADVRKGLTSFPKFLSSKYIYDKKGDKLFQDIMNMPEYYLTDCEFNILEKHKEIIAQYFAADNGFDLIELGAGDGKKTKILLKYLSKNDFEFDYLPIDISQNSLDQLEKSIGQILPKVKIKTLQGMYFAVLDKLAEYNKRKKVIMVLGSNIGNLRHKKAIEFLQNIRNSMGSSDLLFMGFDQKKHPQIILDAYNDKTGITSAFNKNILVRINREMNADFDTDQFIHWEVYNPETGTAKSYLVSKIAQEVNIRDLDLIVSFKKWESIHVEISQKYDDQTVEWLAGEAGLTIKEVFADDKNYYKNYIFEPKDS
ncbi:MAG TPA: L-histidine N(alpha)-methyltransferase [Flavobacteriaceae bacterium]|nr:L-histidine N(alpha)-methyltransferase [Flavobacteriaceae bacterium]